jgi:hypothetical protein
VVANPDLSAAIHDALRAELPADDFSLVMRVDVSTGWGDIHLVSVYSKLSRRDAGDQHEETILRIVNRVLADGRSVARIVWA